jgi:hypothetical protein
VKLRAEHPDHGEVTGSPGEVHAALTGWFANDGLDKLLLVDYLMLAQEAHSYSRHAMAVNLGVDLDEI